MPRETVGNPRHERYHEFRVLISTCLIGLPLMLLFPIPIYCTGRDVTGYLINDLMVIATLLCSRYFGHYRIPMSITAIATYYIIYGWISDSGLIFSTNATLLHMFVLCAIWADKRYGWITIPLNLAMFGLLYYQTTCSIDAEQFQTIIGSASYALAMNALVTIFFGGFLAYLQMDQERERLRFKALQEQKIEELDLAVKERTRQLGSMRESIASDFHDQTGNLLSAITRQASLLRHKYDQLPEAIPIVEGIIANSATLYASSKDFLWRLNHQSDDAEELFGYLTAFGQQYYNNFDIAFSSQAVPIKGLRLPPSSALELIYIFKEAMTNVAKHAHALEVVFHLKQNADQVIFSLEDNGSWKTPDPGQSHYGLDNMRRRCAAHGLDLHLTNSKTGTQVIVSVPAINPHP